jgi:hypothetical protein
MRLKQAPAGDHRGQARQMFFVGRQPGDERPALMTWRRQSPSTHSCEPLAHFADDHSAEYFWSLLEQLLNDAAATGEPGLLEPPPATGRGL